VTLIQLPRLGRGASPDTIAHDSTEGAHKQAYHETTGAATISDVYGGDGYDSPDEVSYRVPDPFHRLPDDMPFAHFFTECWDWIQPRVPANDG
jgi:hypothetical protein